MSKQLSLDEMIAAALLSRDAGLMEKATQFQVVLEFAGNAFARHLADHFGVIAGECKAEEPEFGGTCTPFYAKTIGQKCPEPMLYYDAGEWTTEDGTNLVPETGKEA